MSYDEQVTPKSDPPLVEPPPPVARLSGILAHSAGPRTEVRAPLQPVDEDESDVSMQTTPPAPAEPRDVEQEPDADVPVEPWSDDAFHALVISADEPPAALEPDPVLEELVTEAVGVGQVERRCELCGDRVHVDADALRCPLGHKLSPAHAKRRWWQPRRRHP